MSPERRNFPLRKTAEAAMLAGALGAGTPELARAADAEGEPPRHDSTVEEVEKKELTYQEKIDLLKAFVERKGTALPDGSKMVSVFGGELMLTNGHLSFQTRNGEGVHEINTEKDLTLHPSLLQLMQETGGSQ